jgi:hypothetical protein
MPTRAPTSRRRSTSVEATPPDSAAAKAPQCSLLVEGPPDSGARQTPAFDPRRNFVAPQGGRSTMEFNRAWNRAQLAVARVRADIGGHRLQLARALYDWSWPIAASCCVAGRGTTGSPGARTANCASQPGIAATAEVVDRQVLLAPCAGRREAAAAQAPRFERSFRGAFRPSEYRGATRKTPRKGRLPPHWTLQPAAQPAQRAMPPAETPRSRRTPAHPRRRASSRAPHP